MKKWVCCGIKFNENTEKKKKKSLDPKRLEYWDTLLFYLFQMDNDGF